MRSLGLAPQGKASAGRSTHAGQLTHLSLPCLPFLGGFEGPSSSAPSGCADAGAVLASGVPTSSFTSTSTPSSDALSSSTCFGAGAAAGIAALAAILAAKPAPQAHDADHILSNGD